MTTTAKRIKQGSDGLDRLYTVRPRNAKSVTDKRGTPSSIQFNVPEDLKSNYADYTTGLTSSTAAAFSDAVSSKGLGFINFMAQSVSYSIQEKSQIMHTFGGQEAVYFYGKSPVMVQLSGTLVDDLDNDQFSKFMGLYQSFLRGSQASKDYCYVTLSLNNAIFQGSFMSISIQQTSDRDTDISFSAQFLAKTFTLVSTDRVFAGGDGLFTSDVNIRDPDPTILRKDILAIIEANSRAAALEVEYDFDEDTGVTLESNPNTGYYGSIPNSFSKLPTLEGLIGFSAADIASFFEDVSDVVTNVASPFTDVLSQIDSFARSAIGMVDAVESGLDDVINSIDSITNQIIGTGDDLNDAVTKICNFPDSISSKLGSIGSPGGVPLKIMGSDSISSLDSSILLSVSSNIGSARGTPEGSAAVLTLSATNSKQASISTSGSILTTSSSGIDISSSTTETTATLIVQVGG